jgi:hypothetical protein
MTTQTTQKPISYDLGDDDFLNTIKKALPDFIKVIECVDDLNGQRAFLTFWINDEDFIKCPEDISFNEFKRFHCEEYNSGI